MLSHVLESICNPLTVTAEVASSSLVVPAIFSKGTLGSRWKKSRQGIVIRVLVIESVLEVGLSDMDSTGFLERIA